MSKSGPDCAMFSIGKSTDGDVIMKGEVYTGEFQKNISEESKVLPSVQKPENRTHLKTRLFTWMSGFEGFHGTWS